MPKTHTPRLLLNEEQVRDRIDRLYKEGLALFDPDGAPPVLIGIRTRGAVIAERMAEKLKKEFGSADLGILDITLYRDDLTRISPHPVVKKTDIPFNLDDRPVLLVDDVLFTGRTVRAALDAMADLGRPDSVRLAVLIDRGGRELPIQADVVGEKISLPKDRIAAVRLKETDGAEEVVILSKEEAT